MEYLIKRLMRKLGIEIKRYCVNTCDDAKLKRILDRYDIDLVLDVGANSGQYGQKLRHIGYRGNILSFEPLSSAFSQLLHKSRRDAFWSIAPRMAIGNTDGEATINISKNSFSSSMLSILPGHIQAAPESNYIGTEKVPIKTLDALWGSVIPMQFKSVYLKIDVQGYEHFVLEGATRIMSCIRGIQTELSLVPLYEGQKLFDEMIRYLTGFGFEFYSILSGFIDPDTARTLQFDGVFIK
jgi:FkbM family methyltransferase